MTENKKSKIPYFFFAFFALFITVDIVYIYLAESTWRGTVTENAYEKGRKYNQTLLKDKVQQNLGWAGKLSSKSIAKEKAVVIFELKDKNGKFIDNAKITINLIRPTQTGFDFKEELILDQKSKNYQKLIKFPMKGLWRVELEATSGENIFQYVERIVVE